MITLNDLAVNGGKKAIDYELPERYQFVEEECNAVMKLLEHCRKTGTAVTYQGEEEEAFCREFANYYGGGFADGVNGGTNAVFVALKALDLPPFSEVIVSCITDAGGMMPIVINNCIPIVADCAEGSFNIGAKEIERLITPRTSAIVVAHIMGEPADMPSIMQLARKYNLRVVEDCAQCHGAKIGDRFVGTFGDFGAFSLMYGKHMTVGGNGGMIFTKDEDLYWKMRRASDRGKPFHRDTDATNDVASLNFNIDELHSVIGREQMKKLPAILAGRRRFVRLLLEKGLEKFSYLSVPRMVENGENVYWYWRLKVDASQLKVSKEEYCNALCAEGVVFFDYSFAFPASYEWFQNRSSKHPWNNPLYQGDPEQQFTFDHWRKSVDDHALLYLRESWGEREADSFIRAFAKVDAVFAKKPLN